MEPMTAEQAAEAARGLTFEKVWAILIKTDAQIAENFKQTDAQIAENYKLIKETQEETSRQIKEIQQETQRQFHESLQETQKQLREAQEETQKQLQESQKRIQESQKRTDKIVADLSKNIGGLGNSLGRFTETMFSTELWKKFNELGFTFTKQGPHVKFIQFGQVIAEVDFFLENGEYALPVEIKTELSIGDVDDHLERIEKIRQYMDERGDTRKLVGAVAGGIISDNIFIYAHKKGLFVIKQTGDSVAVAAMPQGFKPREWRSAVH